MSQEKSKTAVSTRHWGSALMGLVALGALVWLVASSLWSSAPTPQEVLVIHVVSDVPPLGQDRFVYNSTLSLEVLHGDRQPTCLVVLDREGQRLGQAHTLKAEGKRETLEITSSAISAASYGPLWLVALEMEGGCEAALELVKGASGAEQPLVAVAEAVAASPGLLWGAKRIYIHDKLP